MRNNLLDALFLLLDQNDDGDVSLEELAKVMPNAKELMSVMDTNANNLISVKEFKTWADKTIILFLSDIEVDRMSKLCALASMGKAKKKGEDVKANEVFDSIDNDSNGFLTLDELKLILGKDATLFLKSLHSDKGDGKISREEFLEWATVGGSDYDAVNAQLQKLNSELLRELTHALVTRR